MKKVYLIGGSPKDSTSTERSVLNGNEDRIFYSKYGDKITDKTLIISEGYYSDVIRPDSASYDEMLKSISPLLFENGVRPALLFPDPRYNRSIISIDQLSKYQSSKEEILERGYSLNKEFEFRKPQSLLEALKTIVGHNCDFEYPFKLEAITHNYSVRFLKVAEKTDNYFSSSVMQAAQNEHAFGNYENIFLIADSTIVLSVAQMGLLIPVITGFEYVDILNAGPDILDIAGPYMSYLFLRCLPQELLFPNHSEHD